MPLSLSFILIHVIFSTKNREPVLDDTVRPELYAYLATLSRKAGCECLRAGGVADHVHLAIRLSRTMTVAELVETLKIDSSKQLKRRCLPEFAWQRGYGAFSVSPADCDALLHYIDTQKAHHVKQDFKHELRSLLRKYGIEFDEQYLWD